MWTPRGIGVFLGSPPADRSHKGAIQPDVINDPRTLYGARGSVIEYRRGLMKRTLLAVVIAVMISLMIAPHRGGNLLRSGGYAHAPLFVASSEIDAKQLVLQTIFLAVLLAVIVNLEPRRK